MLILYLCSSIMWRICYLTSFTALVNGLANPMNFVKDNGYPIEAHTVVSEDGYITVLHRIPSGINNFELKNRPPVIVTHGTGASSADFLNSGTENGLGYVLADGGFDVWLSNARGNSYSRKHVTLHRVKDQRAFYNYSWHEIAIYDYPAQIDYILKVTGHEKLFYIGQSQGATAYFVLTSMRPEYNKKIRLGSILGGNGIMKHTSNIICKMGAEAVFEIEELFNTLRLYHLPYEEYVRNVGASFCSMKKNEYLCRFGYALIIGYEDDSQLDEKLFPVALNTTPSDFSFKCLFHYGQLVKSGEFRLYDYGEEGNLLQYGSRRPPEYNVKAITAPTALYYGKNDAIVDVKDVHAIASLMPNVVRKYQVPWPKWNHGDFIYAKNAAALLYNEVINFMRLF